ncbi:hypothetical protein CgunFtcFv8_017949 [Champsocephalus gunnari]|uniref:Uncharacterized protein n=1 Tax=Champsocephalus gunnari TaxID=52237 RepID=A0AAN8DNA9_CHAGU|nr:hypothetical protein CgunFtcFv8_017949 [Champsocephalus gunnari]
MRSPIGTYVPLTRVEGLTDVGFPTVPPLEPNLTAFFGARQASSVSGRQPMLAATKDRFVAKQTDRMHQCAFQASAAANNIALLTNSMVEMSEQSKTMSSGEAEEIGKAASTALTLCAAVAVSQARIAAWATQVHRYLWLQQGNIPEGAGKDLLEAPISPDGLFGPQFHTMVESMKSASEQADDIRRHASWLQDKRPQRQQRQQRQHPQPPLQSQQGAERTAARADSARAATASAPPFGSGRGSVPGLRSSAAETGSAGGESEGKEEPPLLVCFSERTSEEAEQKMTLLGGYVGREIGQ